MAAAQIVFLFLLYGEFYFCQEVFVGRRMDAERIELSSLTQHPNNTTRLFAILIRRKVATSLSLLILHKTFLFSY